MAIFQHYKGGVSVDRNPHYIDAVRSQFREHGAELIETYTFRRSPSHMLAVAFIGRVSEAQEYARQVLSSRLKIQTFHGRYPDESIKTDVLKTFDILNPAVNPASVFPHMDAKSQQPDEHGGLLMRVLRVAINPLRLYRAIEWRIRAAIKRAR